MSGKAKVLLDLNILLDVIQKREPFYELSARVLDLAAKDQLMGFVASHSLTTVFYLIKKDRSTADAKSVITNLQQFITIAAVDQKTIQQALNLEYQDFEDAVQMVCALQCKVDYLITRNTKVFSNSLLVPVLQPVEFLALFQT